MTMLGNFAVEHEMKQLIFRLDLYAKNKVPAEEQIKCIRQWAEETRDAARSGWL